RPSKAWPPRSRGPGAGTCRSPSRRWTWMARRAEWWTADLLDASDNRLGRLLRIRGGSLEWSIFRSVKGSGSLELTADPSAAIQPLWLGADRVGIRHHLGDPDGDHFTRNFGIWIATRPSRDHE